MKAIGVDGSNPMEKGEAKLVTEDHENVVRLVSCGESSLIHKIRIFDPDDVTSERPLPERRVGEIRISGPSVMSGYWEDAERTREAFAGGFLKTGTLAS